LFQTLKLPFPGDKSAQKDLPLLIYGGSTATGQFAILYAKLAGAKVAVTASPRNFDLLKSLGADATFDYNDSEAGQKIHDYFGGKLAHVFDTIGDPKTIASIDAVAVGEAGGQISTLLTIDKKDLTRTDKIEYPYTLAYTATGHDIKFREHNIPAKPEDRAFGKKFWKLTEELIQTGQLGKIKYEVREGGLEKLLDGLDDLRQNKVSGTKLVYTV
jgi:NADPH:quinone reductase-like Zn-dependent oxidoreductase